MCVVFTGDAILTNLEIKEDALVSGNRQTDRLPALPLLVNVHLIEFAGLSSRHCRVNWTFLSK